MPADEAAAKLFGLVRLLTIAVCWSRFGGGATAAFTQGPVEIGLAMAFWVFSIAAFLGIQGRLSTLLTGLTCFATYTLLGVFGTTSALASHHVFAQALLTCLVALLPCDRALALRPSEGPISLWSQDVLRLQISVLYLGGVYEKSYAGWLDGSRLEQILHSIYLGSDAVDLPLLGWLLPVLALSVWAMELFLAAAVWVPRLMVPVLLVGLLLHAGIYVATPVGTFSTTMFVFLLAVVPPARFASALRAPSVSRPWPVWVFAPLALAPIAGVVGMGPQVRGFDGLALLACEVEISVDGKPLVVPHRTLHSGEQGILRAAAQACRKHGPVDLSGRCAGPAGWEPVEWDAVCPEVPRFSGGRVSAW